MGKFPEEVRRRLLLAFYTVVLPRFPNIHEFGLGRPDHDHVHVRAEFPSASASASASVSASASASTVLCTDGLEARRRACSIGGEGCDFVLCISSQMVSSVSSVSSGSASDGDGDGDVELETVKLVADEVFGVIRLYRAVVSVESTVVHLLPPCPGGSGGSGGAIKWIPASLNDIVDDECMLCAMTWCMTVLRAELPIWWMCATMLTNAIEKVKNIPTSLAVPVSVPVAVLLEPVVPSASASASASATETETAKTAGPCAPAPAPAPLSPFPFPQRKSVIKSRKRAYDAAKDDGDEDDHDLQDLKLRGLCLRKSLCRQRLCLQSKQRKLEKSWRELFAVVKQLTSARYNCQENGKKLKTLLHICSASASASVHL